jgi:diguanylate cyclase (GGDEF)-like protein
MDAERMGSVTLTKTSDGTDGRLYLLVSLVIVAACALVGFALWHSLEPQTLSWSTAGLLALVAVTSGSMVPVRVRATIHGFSSTSMAVLVGLALLPSHTVIVCTAIGVAIGQAFLRMPPLRVAFNVGKHTLAAGAAAWVVSQLHGFQLEHPQPLRVLGILIAAGLAATLVNEGLAIPVVAFASRTPALQRFLTGWDIHLTALAARIGLAAAALAVLSVNTGMIVVVPLLALSLQLAYANRIRARGEREAWQKLAQSTDELNDVDLDGVLKTAITRAAELFSADEIDVEIQLEDATNRLVRGGSDGLTYDGPPSGAPPTSGEISEVRLEGYNVGDPDVGLLRLRFRGSVKLSEREQYTLRTFASALCTAVRNAAAYAEMARLADQHAHDAAHDPLTSLANRRRLQDEGRAILERRPIRGVTALLFIDLNHFKEVNDTLGHAAGDRVLIEVAHRLEATAGTEAVVARLGGDEFAVLLRGLTAPAVAAHRAQAMLASLTEPIDLDGMRISVEASVGIATAPSRGGMVELMRRADIAMYQAKRTGARTAVYARARDTADIGRLTLGGDLPRAVAEQEITVSFQPIVDLTSGEVVAAEALARWHHPDKGDLDPRTFLEAVERSGVLPAFADAILDQALLAAVSWREAGFDLPVAVNVSPRSLLDRRFPSTVLARLRAHDVPPDRLILELTESLTLSQLDVVDQVLAALRADGIRLALDDFGTGYSSLAMLSRVPVQELKIDREFVGAMETSAEAAAVVRSTVDLGRSLNLTVVAEGVESEPQRRTLWELGCVAGQGHLFARPMPAPRLLATLRRGSGGRPGTLAPPLHDEGTVIRIPTVRRTPPLSQPERLPHWPA